MDPPQKEGFDAEVYFWTRQEGPEKELEAVVRRWISEVWPFASVAYPGRDIPWTEWEVRPERSSDWMSRW